MDKNYVNEEPAVINNEYDYSNVLPSIESITYLVQYCDSVFREFRNLIEEDQKKNEQYKDEYKNYEYKETYDTIFEVYIREKGYNNITCHDVASFESAIKDGNLNHVESLQIKLNLSFKRGKNTELKNHENSYIFIFKPYEITFARKSNYNDLQMNQVEENIKNILDQLPVYNTIFCTK